MIHIPRAELIDPVLEQSLFSDWTILVHTEPQGKPATKSTGSGRNYISSEFRFWEIGLAIAFHNCVPARHLLSHLEPQIDFPLQLDLLLVFPRPKELAKRFKNGQYKYYPGLIPHTQKPDKDNVEKAVMDALARSRWVPTYLRLIEEKRADRQARGLPEEPTKTDWGSLWDEAQRVEQRLNKTEGSAGWCLWDDKQVALGETVKAYTEVDKEPRI